MVGVPVKCGREDPGSCCPGYSWEDSMVYSFCYQFLAQGECQVLRESDHIARASSSSDSTHRGLMHSVSSRTVHKRGGKEKYQSVTLQSSPVKSPSGGKVQVFEGE